MDRLLLFELKNDYLLTEQTLIDGYRTSSLLSSIEVVPIICYFQTIINISLEDIRIYFMDRWNGTGNVYGLPGVGTCLLQMILHMRNR